MAVIENASAERYELHVDGVLAGYVDYRDDSTGRGLTHTEVDPSLEGRGLGGRLVRGALDDLVERRLRLIPICPYVRSYLERHPQYLELVDAPLRESFDLPDPPG